MTGNSMIATILQREPQNLRESIAVWRQLSDIVAQRGMQLNQTEIYQSLHALARLRTKIPEHVRRDTALSVARHGRFAPLVAFYANDVGSVAGAMLRHVQLSEADWLALLPATHDVARSILARRADLPEKIRQALSALGAGALALPSPPVRESAPPPVAYFADELAAMKIGGQGGEAAPAQPMKQPAPIERAEAPPADWTKVEAFKAPVAPSVLDDMLADDLGGFGEGTGNEDGKGGSGEKKGVKTPVSQISELVRRIDRFQSTRAKMPAVPQEQRDEIAAIEASIRAELTRPAPSALKKTDFSTAPTVPVPAPATPIAEIPSEAVEQTPQPPSQPSPDPAAVPAQPAPAAAEQFHFETNVDGLIHWVEGIAPQMVVGLSIALADAGAVIGVDGVAAGGFRQRAEIVNARMSLGGQSANAGEWRFSADPMFDPLGGQFLGYHGIARRPLLREMPYGQSAVVDSNDSIRQLIHELRSPLNAISGFAQIISGQMFGPVSGAYRAMAETIIEDAATVQAIIEDLDAATGDGTRAPASADPSEVADIRDVMDYVVQDLQPLLADQHVGLSITQEGGPFLARGEVGHARRMIGRLLTALIDVSEADSLIVAQLIADLTQDDCMQLRIVRPSTIRFADAEQLLDPGYSPDGEAPSADILSLGFSLRLVGSLASAVGGNLEIAANAMILHLPLATSETQLPWNAYPAE